MTDNTYTEVTWVNGVTPVNKANLDQMQTQYKLVAGIQQYDTLPVTPATGENIAIHDGHLYFWNGTEWELAAGSVVSVNGRTGEVLLTSADVGLDNVDNTSDADKPVSTAQQTALNGKVDKVSGSSLIPDAKITKLDGIDSGAQVNVIEIVKKNGTALTPVSKAVDISVPTALSELTDNATHRLVTDTEKTTWNGKADLVDGKVPASELPSYVDDVIDSHIVGSTPFAADWLSESEGGSALTPAAGKIYIILTAGIYENKEYRWSGTIYVDVSQGVQLGESSSTAYRGDKGKTAYDHSQMTSGNPHNVTKSDVGLGSTEDGAEINIIEIVKVNGIVLTPDANKAVNVPTTVPSGGIDQVFYVDSATTVSITPPASDVSVPVILAGTVATETDFLYTAPLASSFDTTTKMYFSIRITGLTAGIQYGWRPVIRATVSGTTTVIAEIPISSAIYFTPTGTEYYIIVAVPYALTAVFNAPAGTVYTVAVRMIKSDSSTATVYISTDIVNGIFVYFQRSGGYINTDQVFHTDEYGVTRSQTTINDGKQANMTTTTGTLTVAGWSAKSQTISITGVTATTKSVRVSYAVASRGAYLAGGVHCTAQGAGTLTFVCDTTPTAEITVNVELAE